MNPTDDWTRLTGPPRQVTDRDEAPAQKLTAAIAGLGRLTYYGRGAKSDGGARPVIAVDDDECYYSVALYRWLGSPR